MAMHLGTYDVEVDWRCTQSLDSPKWRLFFLKEQAVNVQTPHHGCDLSTSKLRKKSFTSVDSTNQCVNRLAVQFERGSEIT